MTRTERKKMQTEEAILRAAGELFTERGFLQTTMEEIAAKADVSKGTLYNYFSDKDAVLSAYYQGIIADKAQPMLHMLLQLSTVEERLNCMLDAILDVVFENRILASSYMMIRLHANRRADAGAISSGSTGRIISALFQDAQNKGELCPDYPPDLLVQAFQYLCRGYLLSNLEKMDLPQLKEEKSKMISLFLHGAKKERR